MSQIDNLIISFLCLPLAVSATEVTPENCLSVNSEYFPLPTQIDDSGDLIWLLIQGRVINMFPFGRDQMKAVVEKKLRRLTFDIYSFKDGDIVGPPTSTMSISFNRDGSVSKVKDVDITYDKGRIASIGNLSIDYNLRKFSNHNYTFEFDKNCRFYTRLSTKYPLSGRRMQIGEDGRVSTISEALEDYIPTPDGSGPKLVKWVSFGLIYDQLKYPTNSSVIANTIVNPYYKNFVQLYAFQQNDGKHSEWRILIPQYAGYGRREKFYTVSLGKIQSFSSYDGSQKAEVQWDGDNVASIRFNDNQKLDWTERNGRLTNLTFHSTQLKLPGSRNSLEIKYDGSGTIIRIVDPGNKIALVPNVFKTEYFEQ